LLSAASGRLAGRQGNYAELLNTLTTTIVPESSDVNEQNWSTFAGSPRRQHIAEGTVDIGRTAWQQKLKYPAPPAEYKQGPRRVGENAKTPLSYHPVVVRDRLFLLTKMREDDHDRSKYVQDLQVFNLQTGEPAWGEQHLQLQVGQATSSHHTAPLGVARYTLTVHGNKLFARIGNPVTCIHSQVQFVPLPHSIVCLDIEQEGKVLWTINPPGDKTAFEGTPICDGANVYVAIRSGGDVRPQAHLACYDAQTGAPRWKRFIASAETPGQGQIDEITNCLLTLDGERIYFNTNLGAVAAIDTRDGHVAWVYRYPRAQKRATFDAPLNFSRDLTPCLVANGRVFVAPNDTNQIFALDAEFGELCWESIYAETAVHLLGVVDGMLVTSGDALQFFRAEPKAVRPGDDVSLWQHGGKLIGSFADGDKQVGYGRGVIVDHQVYFPTKDAIWVFDTRGATPQKVRDIELPQTRGAKSGNLVVVADHLLIVTNDEIFAFRQEESGGGEVSR
jgi:outer membrane protein assembly factor BamB